MKLREKIINLCLCFLLAGCGYFSDEPVSEAGTYSSENLANSCQIDVEELSQILERDVQSQIDCLEDNLIKFTKYVRRENPNSVSGSELSGFIRRFFKGHAHIIIDSMGIIFDINSLFLRDSRGAISTENIGPLFNLLRVANVKLSKIMGTFKSYENRDIDMASAQLIFENDLREFSEEVKAIISAHGRGQDSSINLEEFFEKISSQFESVQLSEEALNGIMALKKLFLGGKRDVLTRNQLFTLLDRLPELGSVSFSLLYATEENQGNVKTLYETFKRSVETLSKQVYPHRREEVIFKDGEVEGLIGSLFPEEKDLFVEVSRRVKKDLLGTGQEDGPYTYKEIRNVSYLTLSLIEGLIFLETYKETTEGSKSWNENNWNWKREVFLKSFAKFSTYLTTSLNENIYFPNRVELFSFIDFLSEKFETFPLPKEYLPIFPIGKVVIVGGERDSFSKLELLNLISKSDDLAGIAFDLIFSNEDTHSAQDKSRMYFKSVQKVRTLLTSQKYLPVTTVESLLNHLAIILEKPEFRNYQELVEELKKNILGGYPGSISVADISEVLEMAEGFLGRYYYYDISFDAYASQLSSPERIRYLNYRHHKGFKYFTQDEILQYKREFFEIVKTFRVYREEDGTQFYGNTYRRTRKGLLEIFTIRYLFNTVAKAFGHKVLNKDLYALNIEELNDVLVMFKPVLVDYGLWSPYPENFARNALLLADLFQGNSDGDLSMDATEATEYGTLALFAIKAADEVVEKTKKYCEWVEAKEVEGFTLECYRRNFFKVLLDEMNLKERLPKLNAYIKSATDEEAMEFLTAVEGFARESQDQERPETRKDLVLLLGAMLNIESTFLRYDHNQNNIIDPNELLEAFPVYEDAIMVLAKLDESKRSYAKSIFLYMVKNMEMPSRWDVATFHYNPFADKKISSKRLNIGALLYNMLLAAEKAKKEENQSAP